MNFRHYRIQILLRLLLLVGLLGVLAYFTFIQLDFIKSFFLLAFSAMTVYDLFVYIDKRNREVANFIEAILSDDFTNRYPSNGKKGKSFQETHLAFNKINSTLQSLSTERESQVLYIHTLVKQIEIGVFAFDEMKRVSLSNEAICKLLGLKRIIRLGDLEAASSELAQLCLQIEGGESKLLKTVINHQVKHLAIRASEFTLRGRDFKLISIQDIKGELDEHEMEAWQKLIRVLTHEIMNSIAPISSLSNSLHHLVDQQGHTLNDQSLSSNLIDGLEAIKSRSEGLMKFTKDYRSLTRIPLPQIQQVSTQSFITEIQRLFETSLTGLDIRLEIEIEEGPDMLKIDPDLFSQVLINLLKNAKEAIEMSTTTVNGLISLSITKSDKGAAKIMVSDNGIGISQEATEQVFIPFYTSKQEGSGVGLSIVKQIVQLHKGAIEVLSTPQGTTFSIVL